MPATAYQQRLDRGWLLMDLKNWPLAEREFREAIALEPQAATPHAALAWCIARRSLKEALPEALEAVRLEPTLDYAHYTLAHLLIDVRDYNASGEAVDEALRLDPWDVNHHALRARLHIAQNHWYEALRAADEGLQLDPQNAYCLRWKAKALRKLGMPILAEETTAQLLTAHPDDAAAHEQHAWSLLAQGEINPAQAHFRESLRLSPNNRRALHGWRHARHLARWWRRCFHARPKSRIQSVEFAILRNLVACAACLGLLVGLWLLLYFAAVVWSAF